MLGADKAKADALAKAAADAAKAADTKEKCDAAKADGYSFESVMADGKFKECKFNKN